MYSGWARAQRQGLSTQPTRMQWSSPSIRRRNERMCSRIDGNGRRGASILVWLASPAAEKLFEQCRTPGSNVARSAIHASRLLLMLHSIPSSKGSILQRSRLGNSCERGENACEGGKKTHDKLLDAELEHFTIHPQATRVLHRRERIFHHCCGQQGSLSRATSDNS